MRAPLSWLRDFAPIGGDPADLTAALDDLGLVVEGVEEVGEGLADVVVARVVEIADIPGADRIRRVVVDAGGPPVEVVCGAFNFAVGDLVPLAPVGAVLPGGFEIGRRKMRGVTSNGMLCSGRELNLSDDGAGLLVLAEGDGVVPGRPLVGALGIEPDVVFDLAVEGNRPDAWCMAGVARDLAARLGVGFSLPDPAVPAPGGPAVDAVATVVVEDPDLCPRFCAAVLTGVVVGPSPRWMARRLTLAGMRPINNVVDASNYVMLELGQPTHPYDLDRLAGRGLRVRRARPGETLVTLDGVERRLGLPGTGLGDPGEDLVICDAEDTVVGLAGVMGGASSEIAETTTRVLLEAAYFTPMAVAWSAKRTGLRTEASARFERGCDPWGIDRALARVTELLALGTPAPTVAPGRIDVRGDVPTPARLHLPVARVNGLLGTEFDAGQVATLLEPIGFGAEVEGAAVVVTVPTNRPDVRPAPHGRADVIEEVARVHGYSRLPRRQPSWPEVGALTGYQRGRRQVRAVLAGLGASEVWTSSFVGPADHQLLGLGGPAVEVANPLSSEEATLRRSQLPGLLRALAYNADRRQGDLRLFEVGTVFSHPDTGGGRPVERAGAAGAEVVVLPGERELASVVLAGPGDDARQAVAAWHVLAEALRLAGVDLVAVSTPGQPVVASTADAGAPGLHPTRSARLVVRGTDTLVGTVGEVDPALFGAFSLAGAGGPGGRRVGWLEVDLGVLLGGEVARRPETAQPVSRYPSSDVDLALAVADTVPAARVAEALAGAGGDLVESVTLFDVYRGPSVGADRRSLAFRLRFCAADRTLTDAEVGEVRQRAIEAARRLGAELR